MHTQAYIQIYCNISLAGKIKMKQDVLSLNSLFHAYFISQHKNYKFYKFRFTVNSKKLIHTEYPQEIVLILENIQYKLLNID